ncbi:cysteine--tRNA ligase [Mesoplasma syrphidae]|uniref:Cysteine--tRNA ligase n=1 Tax=Mesoplasma syrphidae TaxID=225999 RepID=A0A2K9BZV7_9MOLU|nr:cysteine--tRNA ligase [Mesoplasma syrphidae]AUF83888.1 cysteine--tRNA ligase [Mesoplasma syrphidae]
MKIYDSLTGEKNILSSKKVNIYCCGPTVYNYIHIGNARPVILVDILIRYLKSRGVEVNYLQNITDVDDKIIKKAIEQNLTENEISSLYTEAYIKDLKSLNIIMPTKLIPISQKLPEMLDFIEKLVETGDAYVVDGDVYFDIKKWFKIYGELSGRKVDELIAGERIEIDLKKHDPLDFVIWKKTDAGIKWKSKFGEGRPGWHTECSVLIDEYFNHETIDIHAGGIDLKFPHHENERIQFIAYNQQEIAKNWMHNGHVTLEDEKMSKSLGNTVLVKDFILNYGSNLLRWFFLTSQYRQPLNVSENIINQGEKFFEKIENLRKKVLNALLSNEQFVDVEMNNLIIKEFNDQMDNDINTALVLTIIDRVIKEINKEITNQQETQWIGKFKSLEHIFATLGFMELLNVKFTDEDQGLFKAWKSALQKKDFATADNLRQQLVRKKLV